MKKITFFFILLFCVCSCIGTDYINDRVDPKIFITNPLNSIKEGETYQFNARYINYVGDEIANPNINWKSSNESVIDVSNSGLATGVSVGEAIVTASLTTSEENLLISGSNTVKVSTSTTTNPVKFEGTIMSTSSYELRGDFTLEMVNGVLRLSLGQDYKASTSIPGLYVYLGNTPNAISNAYEIGAVTVYEGAHYYDLPDIGLYDYSYILYWCKPFSVKVGDGKIQ